MNIADLFVRVRGDVTDVTGKLRGVEQSLARVEKGALGAHLSLGRLGNQFSNLAGKIAGVHPIVGNLANVLGDFALGGFVTVGVLGGVAAIAIAYDKLTSSSRQAMEQSDKLIDSLLKAARIRSLGVGGEQKATIQDLAAGTAAHQQRAGFLGSIASTPGTGFVGAIAGLFADKDVQKVVQGSKAMQEAVNQLGVAIAASNDKIAADAKAAADKRRALAEKDASEEAQLQRQISDLKLRIATDELHRIAALYDDILAQTRFTGMPQIAGSEVGQQQIALRDKRERDQLIKLGILVDDSNKNARNIQMSVLQSAQIIVSALNIGGGGRGSSIGSALGGVLGAGLTVGAGVLTSGLWGIAGSLLGSMVGGLFDHKKSVDSNTAALNRLSSLLNEPQGFKVEYYRDQASTARMVYRNLTDTARQEAARGGSVGFQLAGT